MPVEFPPEGLSDSGEFLFFFDHANPLDLNVRAKDDDHLSEADISIIEPIQFFTALT